MKHRSRFMVAAALAAGAIAACVGDSPAAGPVDPDSTSDAASRPDALTSGAPDNTSSGSSGVGAEDASVPLDAAPPTGTVGWGTHFDAPGEPASGIVADSRAGSRIVVRSVNLDGGASNDIRVEWLAADATIAASKSFASTRPIQATGVRLDNAGNTYLSIVFDDAVTSSGETDVGAPPATDAVKPSGIKCAVLRLDAETKSVGWSRAFFVPGMGTGGGLDQLRLARCKVARLLNEGTAANNRVLVSGTFSEAAMYSGSPAMAVATSRAHNGSSLQAYDGFVSVLSTETGEIAALESFGAESSYGDLNLVNVYDADFLTATKVVAVGSTNSPSVSRGATAQILASSPPASLNDNSKYAVVLTVDLLDPAASSGEAWAVAATGDNNSDIGRIAEATAVAGSGTSLVVMGHARSAPVTSSLTVPTLASIPLGSAGRYFAVGMSANGRRSFTHESPLSGVQSALRMDDGRVVVATTSASGVDFGPTCQLAGVAGVGTTLAFFTDPSLTTCKHAVAFPNAMPLNLSGGRDMALLTGYTNGSVAFGAFNVPEAAVAQGFAVEFAP